MPVRLLDLLQRLRLRRSRETAQCAYDSADDNPPPSPADAAKYRITDTTDVARCDVLILGAGPVGCALALELSVQGVSFRIIEEQAARSDKSKALVVQPRTLELLNRHGAADEIVDKGRILRGADVHIDGKLATALTVDNLGTTDTDYPLPLNISQVETERFLDECLVRRGVTIERRVKACKITQDERGVTTWVKRDGGKRQAIRSKYVVGCDGCHSLVRHSAENMNFPGEAYTQEFILCDAHLRDSNIERERVGLHLANDGILATLPLSKNLMRVVVSRKSVVEKDEPAPKIEEVQAYFTKMTPPGSGKLVDVFWLTNFRLHHRCADRYRDGRLFIAGDAAHIHSPAGGQGMNTGIQDAINLGWKLAHALRMQASLPQADDEDDIIFYTCPVSAEAGDENTNPDDRPLSSTAGTSPADQTSSSTINTNGGDNGRSPNDQPCSAPTDINDSEHGVALPSPPASTAIQADGGKTDTSPDTQPSSSVTETQDGDNDTTLDDQPSWVTDAKDAAKVIIIQVLQWLFNALDYNRWLDHPLACQQFGFWLSLLKMWVRLIDGCWGIYDRPCPSIRSRDDDETSSSATNLQPPRPALTLNTDSSTTNSTTTTALTAQTPNPNYTYPPATDFWPVPRARPKHPTLLAADALLDTYNLERRPIGLELLEGTDRAFGFMSAPKTRYWVFARNFFLRHILPRAVLSETRRRAAFGFISEFGVTYHGRSKIVGQAGPGYEEAAYEGYGEGEEELAEVRERMRRGDSKWWMWVVFGDIKQGVHGGDRAPDGTVARMRDEGRREVGAGGEEGKEEEMVAEDTAPEKTVAKDAAPENMAAKDAAWEKTAAKDAAPATPGQETKDTWLRSCAHRLVSGVSVFLARTSPATTTSEGSASEETTLEEIAPNHGAPGDTASVATTPEESAPKETTPVDTDPEVTASEETTANGTPAKGTTAEGTPTQGTTADGTTAEETTTAKVPTDGATAEKTPATTVQPAARVEEEDGIPRVRRTPRRSWETSLHQLCAGPTHHLFLFGGTKYDVDMWLRDLPALAARLVPQIHAPVKVHYFIKDVINTDIVLPEHWYASPGNQLQAQFGFGSMGGYVLVRPDLHIAFLGSLMKVKEFEAFLARYLVSADVALPEKKKRIPLNRIVGGILLALLCLVALVLLAALVWVSVFLARRYNLPPKLWTLCWWLSQVVLPVLWCSIWMAPERFQFLGLSMLRLLFFRFPVLL